MSSSIKTYIDILGSDAGVRSNVTALHALDATVKKNDASIKGLEKSYADATAKAESLRKSGDTKGANKAAAEAAKTQAQIGRQGAANAAAEKAAAGIAAKSMAAQAALERAKGVEKVKNEQLALKQANVQRAESVAQAKHYANLVKVQRGLAEAPKAAQSEWTKLASKTAAAGGPLGSVVGTLQKLSEGGKVGVAIAIAAALALVAVGGAYAAVEMTRYALGAADAARSSRLLSEAATGSARAGTELEMVVDQMSNLAPGLSAKLKDVGRSLADVNIRGRDAQRVLETFGVVATARGEQAAGAIKSIVADSSTPYAWPIQSHHRRI
jgi:hypothetical protein